MHNELHSVAGMSYFLGEVVLGTFACVDTSVLTNRAACEQLVTNTITMIV